MKKKTANESCDCIKQVDEQLKPKGFQVEQRFMLKARGKSNTMELSPPLICLQKIGTHRKRNPAMVCSYCPFCGKKYPD